MNQANLEFTAAANRLDGMRVAYELFNRRCRPVNFSAAVNDPLFAQLLRARAKQLLNKNK